MHGAAKQIGSVPEKGDSFESATQDSSKEPSACERDGVRAGSGRMRPPRWA